MKYEIEIQPAGVHFKSDTNLLDDALSQSIPLEHSCKTGDCGVCSAEVLSGVVENEHSVPISAGSVLTCQSKALSNVILKAHYYPELAHIKQQTVPCKVVSSELVSDDIMVLKFRFPPTAHFDYLPGQYVDLSFKGVKRSYSIANAINDTKELELHIRKVPEGKMSSLLFESEVKVNQLMRLEGPKGTFFVHNNDKPLLLLATGTGIAPIKAMVEQLIADGDAREIYIFWGMQYAKELYCKELVHLSTVHSHIKFFPVLSRESEWSGYRGYVQEAVCRHFESLAEFEVYACGSPNMIENAKTAFMDKNLPDEAFHSDAFTPAK